MVAMKQIKLKTPVNTMLEALVEKRKAELNPANNKQAIVEELIIKAFKREIKE